MTASQFGDHFYERNYSPPVSPRSQPNGLKRKANDDEIESQSHISNHFKKLRLHNARFKPPAEIPPLDLNRHDGPSSDESPMLDAAASPPLVPPNEAQVGDDEFMRVDDTSHRVFVPDLDAEIAAIEADEEKERSKLFLPEFEKEVARLPQHLFRQQDNHQDPSSNMQIVLYRDPTSISVPEEEDAVRKTIIEARSRARQTQKERQAHEDRHRDDLTYHSPPTQDLSRDMFTEDPDAMEIE